MFQQFLEYSAKADEIVINELTAIQEDLPEAIKLFSHVLCAQHIWAKRILGETPDLGVWDIFAKDDFLEISRTNYDLLKRILETINLDEEITYVNSQGHKFTGLGSDIMLHVMNHNTYHRGQIATMIRKAGYVPPVTDYIILKRKNLI